jgi:predicted N-formylglutamate amidohydrolase
MLDAGVVPALVSIHSFTPVFDGFERPWHVALLSGRDRRMTEPLLAELGRDPSLVVGDNEPYSGWDPAGYAIHVYGEGMGLPHAVFEIRQDLIDTHHGAEAWAYRLAAALRPVLSDESHYRVLASAHGDR